jgi:hypothetical protein
MYYIVGERCSLVAVLGHVRAGVVAIQPSVLERKVEEESGEEQGCFHDEVFVPLLANLREIGLWCEQAQEERGDVSEKDNEDTHNKGF